MNPRQILRKLNFTLWQETNIQDIWDNKIDGIIYCMVISHHWITDNILNVVHLLWYRQRFASSSSGVIILEKLQNSWKITFVDNKRQCNIYQTENTIIRMDQ